MSKLICECKANSRDFFRQVKVYAGARTVLSEEAIFSRLFTGREYGERCRAFVHVRRHNQLQYSTGPIIQLHNRVRLRGGERPNADT
jgi:hypothetical protein